MKLTILLLCLLLLACNSKSDNRASAVSNSEMNKADSLKTVADSIATARKLHMTSVINHMHKPGDNLATVAHQDPERDRMIRQNIEKNRELRLSVNEQQIKAMAEISRQEREKSSPGVI